MIIVERREEKAAVWNFSWLSIPTAKTRMMEVSRPTLRSATIRAAVQSKVRPGRKSKKKSKERKRRE
jgi:hypothetical protein